MGIYAGNRYNNDSPSDETQINWEALRLEQDRHKSIEYWSRELYILKEQLMRANLATTLFIKGHISEEERNLISPIFSSIDNLIIKINDLKKRASDAGVLLD